MTQGNISKRQMAIEHLQYITTIDPLYKPARFFLAYARLLDGEAQQAEDIFAAVTASVNREADFILQAVKDKWPQTGPRGSILIWKIKPLGRLLHLWLDLWRGITAHLMGGTLYLDAKQWSEFDQRLNKWKEAHKQTKPFKDFEEAYFRVYIQSFTKVLGIQKYVKIAAGLTTSDISAETARKTLDFVLDEKAIWSFDLQLQRLALELPFLKMDKISRKVGEDTEVSSEVSARDDQLSIIRQLRETAVGRLLRPRLEKLEKLWEVQDWEGYEKQVRELRNWTQRPSEYEAGALLLRALKLPKKTEWLIRFFLPVYTLLDPWQAAFRHAFFLECEFYRALAKYRTFARLGLFEASERAFMLHDRFLVGPVPTGMDARRHRELQLLARCLEADGVVRVVLDDEQPDPEHFNIRALGRLIKLGDSLISNLLQVSADDSVESSVRAAVLNTLGLLERYKQSRHESIVQSTNTQGELLYFRQALELERSPDTCFYIAESLLKRGQDAEASLYLNEALRLCPKHPGALSLQADKSAAQQPV